MKNKENVVNKILNFISLITLIIFISITIKQYKQSIEMDRILIEASKVVGETNELLLEVKINEILNKMFAD